jgi:hypothetical protein
MQLGRCPGELIRRIGFFALIGFAVLFLSAPVIAVISAVLSLILAVLTLVVPFALIGLLVWIPLRGFSKGAGAAWKDLHLTGEMVRGTVNAALHLSTHVTGRMIRFGNTLREILQEKASFIGAVLLEILCGALVGAVLGALPGLPYQPNYVVIACCTAIGAMLGILVAISRVRISGRVGI